MSDILERLRLRQSRIVDGTMHTCGDTCTHPYCLAVASLREIESLRAERDALKALLAKTERANAELNVEVSRLYACRNELQDVTQAIDDPAVNNTVTLVDAVCVLKARHDVLLKVLRSIRTREHYLAYGWMWVRMHPTEYDALKARLAEWDKAADFYRRCKADPKSHEVGAMQDAVEWLCSIAARLADSAGEKP